MIGKGSRPCHSLLLVSSILLFALIQVPSPESFVLLGEIGYVMLLLSSNVSSVCVQRERERGKETERCIHAFFIAKGTVIAHEIFLYCFLLVFLFLLLHIATTTATVWTLCSPYTCVHTQTHGYYCYDSLILMMIEAGMNVDISLFRFVGTRGILLAWVGAMIPMALGIVLATIVLGSSGGDRAVAAIAAGAAFGPTSVRLVQQSLQQAQFANTPVGHLIVTAAVLQELMALVLLSELPAFARATADTDGSWSVWSLLFPMITSRLFLVLGMCLVVLYIPPILQTRVYPHLTTTSSRMGRNHRTTPTTRSGTPQTTTSSAHVGKLELALVLGLALLLMEGAHYFHVSHLMACYLAGLAFCTSPTLQVEWMRQLQRVLQWLSRLLFAATIAFPLGPFVSSPDNAGTSATQVLFQGLILSFAWTGKVAVAFLVLPNSLSHTSPTLPPYTGLHLRDCLVTGWSLACQGELALIVAVTARAHDLVDGTLYASIVVAVVLASIVPPLVLNRILRYYNHTTHKELVQLLAQAELERRHDLDHPLLYPSSASTGGGRARRAQRMAALHGQHPQSQQQRRAGGGAGGMTHSPQEEDIAVLIDLLSISQRDNPIANTGSGVGGGGGPDWMSTTSSSVPSHGGPGVSPQTTTSLRQQSIVFLVIQTQVEGQWGLLQLQMLALAKQGLDVIDHRLWHCPPRQRHRCEQAGLLTIRQSGAVDATKWMSEVYVKAILTKSPHDGLTAMEALEQRILEIREALTASLSQPEEEGGVPAKVHVQRWYPGIVEEVLETTHADNTSNTLVEGGSGSDFVGLSQKKQKMKSNTTADIKWYLTLDESVHKQVLANGVLNERQIQEILESLPALHPDTSEQRTPNVPDGPPPTTTTTTSPSEDPGRASSSETDSALGQPPAPAPASASSSASSLPQPSQPVQEYDDDMAPSSSAPYSQPPQQQRRQRSPVIGGGLFRGETVTQQRMGSGGSIGSSGQQRLQQIMGHRIAISVENNTETFHGRMATKDWRKLQNAYNTNPRVMDQDHGSENDTGNGDDDDDSDNNYNISYGGGGLNQDVVDLYMQPNLPDVTELLCGYVRVDTPVLSMPYPEYDQSPTTQQPHHQPYSDGLTASQLSSAAAAGANAVLSWGGRGRNRDGTLSENNNNASGQSWGDAVRNKARQLRQGGARAMGMAGAGGGNYSPVGQQDPMSMLPQPPQRLDSGGDDIVEQAMELLHVPPDARRGVHSTSPMPTKMPEDAYSTHFEIGDVEDPNAPVPSQPQPSPYHSYPPTNTTKTTKIHSSRHPEEEIEFTSSS